MRARVLIRPKAGILDPQGQAVERALPALGFAGVAQRPRRPAGRARRRGPVAAAGDVRAAARQPADRGLRDRPSVVKFGVVRFPGSCDDVDALLAARGSATRCCCGTATTTCRASTPSIVPGGFSYGDYLRVGAIARFSPVMDEVERFARHGGPGARDLQRLPGAVRGGPAAGRAAAEHDRCASSAPGRARGRQRTRRRGRARARPASGCRSPPSTRPAATARRTRCSTSSRPTARSSLRYAPGTNFNGSLRDIAGVTNAAGNVLGLMPHPEHAVDPLTGSADGLRLFESAVPALA